MKARDKDGYDRLMRRARTLFDENKDKNAIKYATLAVEAARKMHDTSAEINATFLAGRILTVLEEYEQAFVKFTWILTQIENSPAGIDLTNRTTVTSVIRSFRYWVEVAAELPSFIEKNADDTFEACERYIAATGIKDFEAEFLHVKSIALKSLRRYQQAIIVAEEGLALKRLKPDLPGCDLYHYLQVYGDILAHLGRNDEALEVCNEGIAKFSWNCMYWRIKGYINLISGNYSEAINNFNEAIFLKQDSASYRYRGFSYSLTGNTKAAAQDFWKEHKQRKEAVYPALWLAGIGGDFSLLSTYVNSTEWVGHVVRYYLKKISQKELLKRANESTSTKLRDEHLCEAHAFIGLLYESKGETAAAKQHYQLCVATGVISFYGYTWAKAKLTQL